MSNHPRDGGSCWGCKHLGPQEQLSYLCVLLRDRRNINPYYDRCAFYSPEKQAPLEEPAVPTYSHVVGAVMPRASTASPLEKVLFSIHALSHNLDSNSHEMTPQELLEYGQRLDELFKELKILLKIGNYKWSVSQRIWHNVSNWTPEQIASLDLKNQQEGLRLMELRDQNQNLQSNNHELRQKVEEQAQRVKELEEELALSQKNVSEVINILAQVSRRYMKLTNLL